MKMDQSDTYFKTSSSAAAADAAAAEDASTAG